MTPQAAPTQCAPTPASTRSFTRADIVALGQKNRPWEFLPVAARALELAPQDAGIRFLAAANLAALGLPTFALTQLNALSAEVRTDPAVTALGRDLRAAPGDLIQPDELRATCAANLAALRTRGHCTDLDESSWARSLDTWLVCRARDGNIVRAPANDPALSAWVGLRDARSEAAAVMKAIPPSPDGFPAPIILDGAEPGWTLLECLRSRPTTQTGYQPPAWLVEPDLKRLLWSLATLDQREALADPRVLLFTGPGAVDRITDWMSSRLDTQLTGFCVPVGAIANPALRQAHARACELQTHAAGDLQRRVREIYDRRDRQWSSRRYEAALAGRAEPLRVLIPTTRFSTFVRHASADLAAAVRALGHEARVLLERDDSSRFSTIAYLKEIADFQPDLVVLVNYPRITFKGVFPANLPYVAWLQDAMPHLFDPALGPAQTEYDFLAGLLFPELFDRCGHSTRRALPAPVVASGEKFHDGPLDPSLLAPHECEVAMVSHHGQTPEELLESILAPASLEPRVEDALRELVPVIRRAVADSVSVPPHQAIEGAVREHMRSRVARDIDERSLASAVRNFALPIADRVFRHQAVEWAAEICARRSWRLHLYGKGWASHPRLSTFSRGELDHGEALRASYRAARVHLHVSLGTLVHQRVLECALSGGFPLCRLHRDALSGFKTRAQLACAALGEPHAIDHQRGLVGWRVADCPEAMAMTAQLQRLSHIAGDGAGTAGADPSFCWVRKDRLESQLSRAPVLDTRHDAAWLLGDLAETTFWSPETLESTIERAITSAPWRDNVSAGIRSRVRAELTHDAFLRRLLTFLQGSLREPLAHTSPAPDSAPALNAA